MRPELVIALVVRTRRRFFRSRPGRLLLYSTIALAAITVAYVVAAEVTKSWFYRHEHA